MIEEVKEKTAVVEVERSKIQGEKDEVDKKRDVIFKIKTQCDNVMREAEPKIKAAQDALNKLDEKDLGQLRSYANPSQNIILLSKNVTCLFGIKGREYSDFKK